MTRTDVMYKTTFNALVEERATVETKPLLPPNLLKYDVPVTSKSRDAVSRGRQEVRAILNQQSDRLLVIVGPCSIHDTETAIEYAARLKQVADALEPELCIVMRAYLEKPRTTVGWKGLINDPNLDGSYDINSGLRRARKLFVDITDQGLPLATELLDTISPQYLSDLISVGAIGARTTESALHRELASGAAFPIGFKNSTSGSIKVAIDSIKSASIQHSFIGVNQHGLSSISLTKGNPDCFTILRGGESGPNYDRESVGKAKLALRAAGHRPTLMVDCSHGNSNKDYRNQPKVANNIAQQIISGETGIVGVMIESNLQEGRQDLPPDGAVKLRKGVSITDGCIGWEDTVVALQELAASVRLRRQVFAARQHY